MLYRGVEQLVARQAHNLEVSGSIPLSATIYAARILFIAKIAQLVEHDLAKVGVAGSSPVFRSSLRDCYLIVPCPDGGIGRRAGLKHQ